jgi:hypothetical protein
VVVEILRLLGLRKAFPIGAILQVAARSEVSGY